MNQESQIALEGIRSLAFELIKNSSERERKLSIEDSGDYCSIQLTIRVIDKNLRVFLDKAKFSNS